MIGIDEVGMSAIAGPVVICGVKSTNNELSNIPLRDSKELKPQQRLQLAKQILDTNIQHTIILVSPQFLEKNTLVAAVMYSVPLILEELGKDKVIIDGKNNPIKYFKTRDPEMYVKLKDYDIEAIVKADTKIPEVMAAAILAKVFRDNFMKMMGVIFPGYGWETNVGYPCRKQFNQIEQCGITVLHRKRIIYNRIYKQIKLI